jgi:signal transduction histidine kinase
MTRLANRSILALGAMGVLAAVVLMLAILQFRWTGQISQAELERRKATLTTSVRQFRQEFSRALQGLCAALQPDPAQPAAQIEAGVLRGYASWSAGTTHPTLVAGLHLWMTNTRRSSRLISLDPKAGRFRQIDWSGRFKLLNEYLGQLSAGLTDVSEREAYRHPWFLHEDTPALVYPLFHVTPASSARASEAQFIGFLVAELNIEFLRKEYLPDLAERHFGSPGAAGFQVVVRSAQAPYQTVYQSSPQQPVPAASADVREALLAPLEGPGGGFRGPMLWPGSMERQWEVLVRHPAGSLEAAIAALRRRNLAVSFGLLFALAAATALILELARRAQKLAQLQMEFVARVSHELCTPLTVICSAGDNLADGVLDDSRQVREYGGMIRNEGRRLARMVDEVLQFSAGDTARFTYDLVPVQVGEVIDRALAAAAPMLEGAGFTVEREIAEGMPPAIGDPAALGQCLENLIGNAVKHAGANRWLAVRARTSAGPQPAEVQVAVEDKGPGIPAGDLPRVFEPFYRATAARKGQVRGVGLGLHLVKRMMEAMGGRVTVSSRPGQGSRFTLHLGVAAPGEGR